jgi:hypothetical protein
LVGNGNASAARHGWIKILRIACKLPQRPASSSMHLFDGLTLCIRAKTLHLPCLPTLKQTWNVLRSTNSTYARHDLSKHAETAAFSRHYFPRLLSLFEQVAVPSLTASGAHAAGGAAGASWRDAAAARPTRDAFKTTGGEGSQVLETDRVSAAVTPGSFDFICPSRFDADGGPYFQMTREHQPEITITTRDTSFRQQVGPNTRSLEYPYSFIEYYNLVPKAMIGEPREQRIDFPSCVTRYYWIHAGMNDQDAWRALFEYKDENERRRYGFYAGECGYTGFDCTGCMELYVSDRYEVLIMKALSDYDYSLYMRSTKLDQRDGTSAKGTSAAALKTA